jgi:alkylation response protein AidB-like acyl-CoA dehydrogenase
MDFDDAPQDKAFRDEFRAWLASHRPGEVPADAAEAFAFRRAMQREMAAGGWAAPGWPRAWGGREASVSQSIIYQEELALAGLPPIANAIGVWNVGPALLVHGTDEQRARWLPAMLRADEMWCQGFSEPDAGSDLANVQTRAARSGDEYVVNGQKIWISYGGEADRCFLLCRTGGADERHRGLTVLVADMRARGVEVRPLRDIAGARGFSEVFFTDAVVPVADRIGEEGEGWSVAMSTLAHERVGAITYGIQLRQKLDALLARPEMWPEEPVASALRAQQVGALYTAIEIIRLTALRAVTKAARGEDPWPETPIGKLLWSVTAQELPEVALSALGMEGLLWPGDARAPDGGRWALDEIAMRMTTIAAGTTEVQKNVLAERALGLPRG